MYIKYSFITQNITTNKMKRKAGDQTQHAHENHAGDRSRGDVADGGIDQVSNARVDVPAGRSHRIHIRQRMLFYERRRCANRCANSRPNRRFELAHRAIVVAVGGHGLVDVARANKTRRQKKKTTADDHDAI